MAIVFSKINPLLTGLDCVSLMFSMEKTQKPHWAFTPSRELSIWNEEIKA